MLRLSVVVLALLGLATPAVAADPKGDWLVENKGAVIRVSTCAGNNVCGNIVWTKGPRTATDTNNPDPAKRSRPILGLQMFEMKPTRPNRWEGEIYNAEDGKTYASSITMRSDNVLRIEGCVLGFLCGGQDWSRAKCDEAPPPPAAGGQRPAARLAAVTSCREIAR
jgi:uncharacterized protein (DUF2147 family)